MIPLLLEPFEAGRPCCYQSMHSQRSRIPPQIRRIWAHSRRAVSRPVTHKFPGRGKINIPRNDLKVTVDGIATPTPFGFGGWLAMSKGSGGSEVMMGDLVLLEDEVNPVMSALLDNGLEVTAVHNHFFFESPRIFYMHVHGH